MPRRRQALRFGGQRNRNGPSTVAHQSAWLAKTERNSEAYVLNKDFMQVKTYTRETTSGRVRSVNPSCAMPHWHWDSRHVEASDLDDVSTGYPL